MLYGIIECGIKCPKCDNPIPLNGPIEVAHCDQCLSNTDVPNEFWTDILGDLFDELRKGAVEGEGNQSTIFGTFNTSLLTGRLDPRCHECKTHFDVDETASEPYKHTCEKCGNVIDVRPGPDWLNEAFPPGTILIAADMREGGEEQVPASEPIAFTCPQCGGALIVDGTERVLPCGFCGIKVYLPDDLWRRMHPVKKKERWWVGFKLPGAERTEEVPDVVICDGSSPYPRAWPNHGLLASGARGFDSGIVPKLKQEWRVKLGTTDYRNNPALVDARVYVTSGVGSEGNDNMEGLWCLDAGTGDVLWHFSTAGEGDGNCKTGVVAAYGNCYFGCANGNLYCVSAESGELVWKVQFEEEIDAAPTVHRGRLYLIGDYYYLYCLDAATGETVWKIEYDPDLYTPALAVNGKVIISSDDEYLVCADANSGVTIWKTELEYDLAVPPIEAEGKVFYACDDGSFHCRSMENGELIWKSNAAQSDTESAPAYSAGRIFFGARDDHVHCISAESGEEIWKFHTDWGVDSSPCVADGRVYVGTDDGTVYALDVETGKKLDKFKTGEDVNSPLIIVNGRVYFLCQDGYFYCLR